MITGIAGQDGSYLSEILLARGYTVAGVVERDPSIPRQNLAAIEDQLELHAIDLTDRQAVDALVESVAPTEIYNLAAPSVVPASWDDPIATLDFMCSSVVCLLDAIVRISPETRFFHAASSEIFRGSGDAPQSELTTPCPTSPYGVGKLAGHGLVNAYRRQHDVFACSGILYNHESPRRPESFVTRKIVSAAVRIKLGEQDELVLGDTSAQRDWGYAPDYVDAMWRMLQHEAPDDYVVATGELHTVEDLVNKAFELVGLDANDYVRSDPALMRKGDEALLVGDPSKLRDTLGWRADMGFERMLEAMVASDLAAHSTSSSTTSG